VSLANRMALASEHVTAICVEANEFPRLSAQFGVRSVPRTVINGSQGFVGALPEKDFVAMSLKLAGVALDEPPPEAVGESTDLAD
jgi:thioredoxin-like negative regulator of GroEL